MATKQPEPARRLIPPVSKLLDESTLDFESYVRERAVVEIDNARRFDAPPEPSYRSNHTPSAKLTSVPQPLGYTSVL